MESWSSRPAWFTQESQASQAYILRLCLKNNKSNPLTNYAELMNQHRPTNPRLLQALGKATSHYLISRAFFFFLKEGTLSYLITHSLKIVSQLRKQKWNCIASSFLGVQDSASYQVFSNCVQPNLSLSIRTTSFWEKRVLPWLWFYSSFLEAHRWSSCHRLPNLRIIKWLLIKFLYSIFFLIL